MKALDVDVGTFTVHHEALMTSSPSGFDPSQARAWLEKIVALGPRRVAGSQTERLAHDTLREDLLERGVPSCELLPFRHNRSLYANMALHFLIATLASGLLLSSRVHPLVCLGLHLFVVWSYWCESNKKRRVLRHLFPWKPSQNLVATSPATADALRRRIVIASHIDAAFTGILFHPTVLKQALKPPPFEFLMFLRKSMLVSTGSVLILGALDVAALFLPPDFIGSIWWVVLVVACTIPAFLTVFFNGQVVVQNQVVPGVNDNLTGCYALLHLAERLLDDKPDDVEIVFVATGCEEAGTGGSWALSEQMLTAWEPTRTTVIGVDTLSGGVLHYFEEGELMGIPVPGPLRTLVHDVLPEVARYPIPSGATDALPFLVRGYQAMTFGCVDPDIGAPRNYHFPTDDVAHLDFEQLGRSLDQIERFLRALMRAEPGE